MARKKIKKRSQVKRSTNTNAIKATGRRSSRRKTSNTTKIAIGLAIVALLLLCYMSLGLTVTALFAIAIGILLGVWILISRIPSNKKKKKILNILLILFLTFGIICLAAFSLFIAYVKISADPKYEKAKLNTLEITRIYDKDGNEIAKLGSEKREKVTYDELPEVLVDAIIATEDSRFFQHNGLDAPRFFKATMGQLTGNHNAGGASTLTMQVVKNSFTDKYGQ